MIVQAYIFLDGRCEEAIEFYKGALGAQVEMLMHFKDSPDPNTCAPGTADKVMHASIKICETSVMLSDGRCTSAPKFEGFALSITADTAADADRIFAALSDGGQVQMPLTETFFSARFGMAADKFGVSWMVLVAQ